MTEARIRERLNTVRRTKTPDRLWLRRVLDEPNAAQQSEIYRWVEQQNEATHQITIWPDWPDAERVSHIVAYADFDPFPVFDREVFERLAGSAMERADALIENLDLYDWVVLVRTEAQPLCRFWEEMATHAFVKWYVYPALLEPIEEANDGDTRSS